MGGEAMPTWPRRTRTTQGLHRARAGRTATSPFIMAAENGVALGDLKPFTRRLMGQMEQDFDTSLDQVAGCRTQKTWIRR